MAFGRENVLHFNKFISWYFSSITINRTCRPFPGLKYVRYYRLVREEERRTQ